MNGSLVARCVCAVATTLRLASVVKGPFGLFVGCLLVIRT